MQYHVRDLCWSAYPSREDYNSVVQAIQAVKGSITTKTGGEIKFPWRVAHCPHGMEGMSYIMVGSTRNPLCTFAANFIVS